MAVSRLSYDDLLAECQRHAANHDQVVRWLREKEAEVERLRNLIASMYLYFTRHGETQLTTEQKELLYDTVDAHAMSEGCGPMERWWR